MFGQEGVDAADDRARLRRRVGMCFDFRMNLALHRFHVGIYNNYEVHKVNINIIL